MRNIFFSDDCEFLRKLPFEEVELQRIENFFIRFAPLSLEEVNLDSLCSHEEWRERFSDVVQKKSTRELAELSIQLCRNYYKYDEVYNNYHFHTEDVMFFERIKEMSNDFSLLIDVENNQKLENEIVTFLILSYFYEFIPKIKDLDTDEKKILYEIFGSNKVRNNQTSRYKNKKSLFMEKFLLYDNEGFDIQEQSPYDFSFVKSMLRKMPEKNNPFILKNDKGDEKIKVSEMLERFKDNMSLLKDDVYLNSTLKRIFGCKDRITIADYYNQYIYERLLLVNFLDGFYHLKAKKIYSQTILNRIKEFLYCPLLDFRLNVIEFHEEKIAEYEGLIITSDFTVLWQMYLNSIVHQLTRCTLPMTIMTFNYLMDLRYQNKCCGEYKVGGELRKGGGKKGKIKKEFIIKKMMLDDFNATFVNYPKEYMPEFYKNEEGTLIPSKVYIEEKRKRNTYGRNYPANEYIDFFNMNQEKGVRFDYLTNFDFIKQDITRSICEGIANGRYTADGIIKAEKNDV